MSCAKVSLRRAVLDSPGQRPSEIRVNLQCPTEGTFASKLNERENAKAQRQGK